MSWIYYQEDWLLNHKCTFDPVNRLIVVSSNTTTFDIKGDLYSSWKEWVQIRDNAKYLMAIRTTGGDPIGGGQYTGDVYFLVNNWKLVIDLTKVKITGVLYSDNFDTAYFSTNLEPQYPATVSALVNTVTISTPGTSAAELWAYNNRSLSIAPPTAAEVADATWAHTFANKLLTVAKFLGLK